MRALFTLTIFLGSFLLFLIQPMLAKMVLPAFGGAPAVWNVSLVFFQALLLAGYAYANFVPKWIGDRRQLGVHGLLYVAGVGLAVGLGIGVGRLDPSASSIAPSLQLLLFLLSTIGLPYFLVSTGAPLVQHWFARTNDPSASDPYFLYAASNVGSLLGLLAYPFGIEGWFPLRVQTQIWTAGFALLMVLVFACGLVGVRGHEIAPLPKTAPPNSNQRLRWLVLAAVPSSLLLGVTSFLTTNLASLPLLWIVPLSLYLITFVVAFGQRAKFSSSSLGRWVALLMAPMALVLALEATDPLWLLGILHLTIFALGALACHRELAESRPAPDHLTEFYLIMSLGGVLGGSFNALLAPTIFRTVVEYPVSLVALLLLRKPTGAGYRAWREVVWPVGVFLGVVALGSVALRLGWAPSPLRTAVLYGLPAVLVFLMVDRPVRYALGVGGFLVAINLLGLSAGGNVEYAERSFFGVHRILLSEDRKYMSLVHGVTIHGRQAQTGDHRMRPLTYYYPTGPVGLLFEKLNEQRRPLQVGLVGLGVGSLAAYSRKGDEYTYYEIDPVVIKVASDPKFFSFVSNAAGRVHMVEGDARLSLLKATPGQFDVLVLDAFSSDAIPLHLLTKEAIELYLSRLKSGGLLAFHISNRYLSLSKVLAGACDEMGLAGRYANDTVIMDEEKADGKEPSQWFLVARSDAELKALDLAFMYEGISDLPRIKAWTDDRSNMLEAWGSTAGPLE